MVMEAWRTPLIYRKNVRMEADLPRWQEPDFAASSAPGVGAVTFRPGESQSALSEWGLLRVCLAVKLSVRGFHDAVLKPKLLRLFSGNIRNHCPARICNARID